MPARGAPRISIASLRKVFLRARRHFPEIPPRISVALVADDAMAAVHRDFSSIDGTTDVLAFDLRPAPVGAFDGEVVICFDVARREAAMRGRSLQQEVELYLVHGLLHLAGFDDHKSSARARMHAAERQVIPGGRGDSQRSRSGENRGSR